MGPHGTCADGVNSHSCYCDPGFQETKISCYLKEDQFEFLEERRQTNVSYRLNVNEFASLMRQSLCPGTPGTSPTMCGVA